MYHKWHSYDEWFQRYEVWLTDFFVILDRFLHFYSPNNLKNQNFQKMKKTTTKKQTKKKTAGDIILHMCTINDNHVTYGSWDMGHDRHNFLSFWTIFCPFTLLTAWKMNISKNEKNAWRYHHLTQMYQKLWSYTILFLRYGVWWMQLLFFILDFFLYFYQP